MEGLLPAPLRRYEFYAQALALSLEDGAAARVVDGVPPDAELRDAGWNPRRQKFYMTLEHESFPTVEEGEPIPTGRVTLEELPEELTDSLED